MLSPQNRIAGILIVSIMAILTLGMVTSFLIVTGFDQSPSAESAADVLVAIADATTADGKPPDGVVLTVASRELVKELRARGVSGEARIVEEAGTGRSLATYLLPTGTWVTVDAWVASPPPSGAWLALATLTAIAVLGVSAVALIMARRVTEPYDIIERAVGTVDHSGELPQVSVEGSIEARRVRAALNSLSRRLKSAMQSRMRLVAAAGHDLRTPMTRMRLRTELLPEEDQADWLADVDELEQIAESAMGLVREESGYADLTFVDMASLVKDTVYELAEAELPVRLTALQQATVQAGPLSLTRALRNLIINAATHGGGADVSLTRLGDEVFVTIEDRGPGIPEHLLPEVFEPFFRGDPSRTSKGAGLGLSIANEIIERLGGSLTLSNRPGGGLIQVVILPVVVS